MDSSQNNPFGSFGTGGVNPGGFSSPMTGGASDDIVLTNNVPNKSKKGLIIGIIVGVLIVVGLVVGFLVMQKPGKINTSDILKNNFNHYMNYLLYGIDSTEGLVGEYNVENGAEIYGVLSEEHTKMVPYAAKLGEYWDEFYNSVNDFVVEEMTRDDYNNRVKFVITYLNNSLKLTDEEAVFEIVSNSGVDAANNTVNDYFSKFEQFDFEEARNFIDSGKVYYSGVVKMSEALLNAGCMSDGENAKPCDEEAILGESEEYAELGDHYADMSNAVDDIVGYLIENGWKINTELNRGNE